MERTNRNCYESQLCKAHEQMVEPSKARPIHEHVAEHTENHLLSSIKSSIIIQKYCPFQ